MAAAKRLGWIGLGQMGAAHVSNLLASGTAVTVWNRDESKSRKLVEQQLDRGQLAPLVAASPMEVVEQSDISFVMLSNPSAARQVYKQADGGILAAVTEGKGIIDCASLDAECMAELQELVTSKAGQFLAAPVAGHSGMAEDATCQFLCAGNEELYNAVAVQSSVLASMSKNDVYLGKAVVQASNMKLVINGLLASVTASVGEAMALIEKADLDQSAFKSLVDGHAMNSPLFQLCYAKMNSGDHSPPLFMIKHMSKDAALACALADEVGVLRAEDLDDDW